MRPSRVGFGVLLHLVFSIGSSVVRGDYHWPSPFIDTLEGLLYEGKQEGLPDRAVDFVAQLLRCEPRVNNESIAADWIRFAYHDMATHNIDDGTGGLDNSITMELDRDESKFDFIDFPNKYLSYSDTTAMGVVLATVECGGPVIAYRGGRIDAKFPGPPGVPVPEQSAEDFIETFRKQGFTKEEMIALVACGHTLGGVRNPDFPTLVPPGDIEFENNIKLFDGTPQFDNTIVTSYLDGTTENLLVVGANGNTTLTSDLRVFGSDGNVTMKSLADPDHFAATCASLLGRMIDTVPRNVTLTDFIHPLPVKVAGVQLAPGNEDHLALNLTLRLSNNARQVTLHWADRDSESCSSGACSAAPINSTLVSTRLLQALGLSPVKYTFSTPIANTSVSKFWFEVDGKIENNGGSGYVIEQDRILFAPDRGAFGLLLKIVAAVRNDSTPSAVWMDTYQRDGVSTVERHPPVNLTLDESLPAAAGYNFYSASIPGSDLTLDLFAEIDGKVYEEEFRDTHFMA
ncbi:peroxidase [Favolaschia claudopus]|uniref:Peroxidase n=1 Tax=Favolaschia claudopus TaxID=2862362 RepID=A0AAW0EJX9_9AGAR